jgi:hypothetical protein
MRISRFLVLLAFLTVFLSMGVYCWLQEAGTYAAKSETPPTAQILVPPCPCACPECCHCGSRCACCECKCDCGKCSCDQADAEKIPDCAKCESPVAKQLEAINETLKAANDAKGCCGCKCPDCVTGKCPPDCKCQKACAPPPPKPVDPPKPSPQSPGKPFSKKSCH